LAALEGLRRLDELGMVRSDQFEPWAAQEFVKERSLDNIRIWYSLSLESWIRSRA
jgi:hypothetical protein